MLRYVVIAAHNSNGEKFIVNAEIDLSGPKGISRFMNMWLTPLSFDLTPQGPGVQSAEDLTINSEIRVSRVRLCQTVREADDIVAMASPLVTETMRVYIVPRQF